MSSPRIQKLQQPLLVHDHRARIEKRCQAIFGVNKVSEILAGEWAMFFYLLRRPSFDPAVQEARIEAPQTSRAFNYHKESGMIPLLWVGILIVTVEMAGVHLLVSRFSHLVAWLATLSTFYCGLMIVAQIRAVGCRPMVLNENVLLVRNGIFSLATIPLDLIVRVEVSFADPDDSRLTLNATFPASPNTLIYLSRTQQAEIMFGQQKPFDTVVLHLDDPHDFVEKVSTANNRIEDDDKSSAIRY